MSFYERIFENSGLIREHTKEEKRNNIYLFRNSFLAILLTYKFTHTSHMYVTTGILSLGIFLFTFVIKGTIAYIYYAISMPIIIFVVTVYIAINVRIKQKGIDGIETWLCEKFQNLWLLDGRVISYKEWQTIKKDNEWTYRVLRSDECNHKCYDITYVLANILRNPDIKIVWLCIRDRENPELKWRHAVLQKNNCIYDTNFRRTYKRDKYLRAFDAEIFKEYSLEEYIIQNRKSPSDFLDWGEFENWCKTRGAIRND